MYGYIYKTTNLKNGMIYVGQHKSNKFDYDYYGSGIRFMNVFNKYGKDSFKCELLEVCESEQELNEKEQYWIAKLNATDRKIGYNLMSGGYKVRGAKHSQSTKAKISKSKTGVSPNREYIITDETKTKISNTLKEYYKTHKNPRRGVTLSESTKEKLRQANLGKKYSEEVRAKHRRPAWNKGIPMTEEAKKHLSEMHKGKPSKMSEEEKQKARKRWSGKNNPNYGGLKAETKEKIRQSILGRIWITNGIDNKQVHIDEFEQTYKELGYKRGRVLKKNRQLNMIDNV